MNTLLLALTGLTLGMVAFASSSETSRRVRRYIQGGGTEVRD
jgi:hypothetical protein